MTAYQCPFCNALLALSQDTYTNYYLNFYDVTKFKNNAAGWKKQNLSSINVAFIRCPSCQNTSIYAFGHSKDLAGLKINVHPKIAAHKYPPYIPHEIREDYQEAVTLLEHSERAAALFARRCLKNILADFWQINLPTLYDSLISLHSEVETKIWQAVELILNLGNIGEHMKEDADTIQPVDELEAQRLIKLIELFLKESYTSRHNRELLFEQIVNLGVETPLQ